MSQIIDACWIYQRSSQAQHSLVEQMYFVDVTQFLKRWMPAHFPLEYWCFMWLQCLGGSQGKLLVPESGVFNALYWSIALNSISISLCICMSIMFIYVYVYITAIYKYFYIYIYMYVYIYIYIYIYIFIGWIYSSSMVPITKLYQALPSFTHNKRVARSTNGGLLLGSFIGIALGLGLEVQRWLWSPLND